MKEHANLITIIQADYPGFFTVLQETHRVEKEAREVQSTVLLRDMPIDEELMREIIRKYDMVPRRNISTRTIGMQVRWSARDAEAQATRTARNVGNKQLRAPLKTPWRAALCPTRERKHCVVLWTFQPPAPQSLTRVSKPAL